MCSCVCVWPGNHCTVQYMLWNHVFFMCCRIATFLKHTCPSIRVERLQHPASAEGLADRTRALHVPLMFGVPSGPGAVWGVVDSQWAVWPTRMELWLRRRKRGKELRRQRMQEEEGEEPVEKEQDDA